jgi:hypothetical protein
MSQSTTYTLPEACRRLGCGARTVLHLRAEGTLVGVVAKNGLPTFTRESVDAAAERGIGRGSVERFIAPATMHIEERDR